MTGTGSTEDSESTSSVSTKYLVALQILNSSEVKVYYTKNTFWRRVKNSTSQPTANKT